jgi:hypothetical protein
MRSSSVSTSRRSHASTGFSVGGSARTLCVLQESDMEMEPSSPPARVSTCTFVPVKPVNWVHLRAGKTARPPFLIGNCRANSRKGRSAE